MQRQMLKSKIHRATVTGCDADYVGSVTVDSELLEAADILPNELVHLWDITNGSRMVTYAIEGGPGSGEVRVNGAAALLVNEGDKVIIASYANYERDELETYEPVVVHVDHANRALLVDSHPEILLAHPPPGDELPGALGAQPAATAAVIPGGLS
jgi:aspartate 1-decarboxylase